MSPRTHALALVLALALGPGPLLRASTGPPGPGVAPPAFAPQANTQSFPGRWTALPPGPGVPPPRRDPALAYDSRRDRLVLVGGTGGNATWIYDFEGTPGWRSLPGIPPPTTTGDDRAIYDPVGDRVILVTSAMQVWQLSLASPSGWQPLQLSGAPPGRRFFAVAYDGRRNRMLVFGGGPYGGLFSDVWALELGTAPRWVQIVANGGGPAGRWGPVAAYDSARDRLIVAMGSTSPDYAVAQDVWELAFDSPPAWTQLNPTGTLPMARMLAAAIYDPVGQRLILHGGYRPGMAFADAWALDLQVTPGWRALAPEGSPPPGRWSLGAAYRLEFPSLIVCAGFNGQELADLWALELEPETGPPALTGFSPAGGRIGDPVTLVGSYLRDVTDVYFNEVPAPILEASQTSLRTQVPEGARTGTIKVDSPFGTAVTAEAFFVGGTPRIEATAPESAKIGRRVEIKGADFTGATRVSFGGAGSAGFTVFSDETIYAVVDSAAVTGPISVTTPAATGTSAFDFVVIPLDSAARIVSVRDVPRDEGGWVTLRWLASDLDVHPWRVVTGYRVWRRAPQEAAFGAAARLTPAWRREVAPSGMVEFWQALGTVPAGYVEGYAFLAPTTEDSTADANPYTAFFVQTLTTDPFVFFRSATDSGYSVDNLAPPAPAAFHARYAPGGVALHWLPSRAADVAGYRLHRGGAPGFAPDASNLVAASADTGHADADGNEAFVYKLAAVDRHGNVGRYAIVSGAVPSAGAGTPISVEAAERTVRLLWYLTRDDVELVTVQRRGLDDTWRTVGSAAVDADGLVRYTDGGLVTGARYGYRLLLKPAEGAESTAGETWVDLPLSDADHAVHVPNPVTGGEVRVSLAAPAGPAIRVELFDLAGRLVASRAVPAGVGRSGVTLARASDLAPGVYLVRVVLPSPVVRRVVVIR